MQTIEPGPIRVVIGPAQTQVSEHLIMISEPTLGRLGLVASDRVLVKAGKVSATAQVVSLSDTGEDTGDPPVVGVTSALSRFLGLTFGEAVHLLSDGKVLRVGPVVGILAPRRTGKRKPYQAQTSLFRRLMAAANELGIVTYVFDFHDIRWRERRVRGYTYVGDHWASGIYPLPDVIFDRATGRFPGGSYAADRARQRLTKAHGISLFNTRIGEKLHLHRVMSADAVLCKHLPVTRRVTGSDVVAQVMARSGGAYLKPRSGGQGKGIIRVRRTSSGYYYTLITQSYSRITGRSATVSGVLAQLRGRVPLASYIVQRDLRLLRLNGRVCDVRVLVQRDSDGAWHVTGTAVRAGAPGSVVSNLHGGGRALHLEQLLRQVLGADETGVVAIREEIEGLALRVAEVLSKSATCLGELGVDVGVDVKGGVWIIEANSRTGRAVFRRCGLHESAKLADRRPLRFAMHLAGFTIC